MASKSRAPIELFESRLDVALKALCHPILSWLERKTLGLYGKQLLFKFLAGVVDFVYKRVVRSKIPGALLSRKACEGTAITLTKQPLCF